MYYYRARYYSSELGRFLQTDPIGYYAGMNLYSYVANSPTNYVDPLGLDKVKKDPLSAIGEAISRFIMPDAQAQDPSPRDPVRPKQWTDWELTLFGGEFALGWGAGAGAVAFAITGPFWAAVALGVTSAALLGHTGYQIYQWYEQNIEAYQERYKIPTLEEYYGE